MGVKQQLIMLLGGCRQDVAEKVTSKQYFKGQEEEAVNKRERHSRWKKQHVQRLCGWVRGNLQPFGFTGA